jgi:hypothetical protein
MILGASLDESCERAKPLPAVSFQDKFGARVRRA